MARFSFPAFLIADFFALRRDAGRRVALMDGVVAGASGSVMLGVILGALARPRQRQAAVIPVLTAQLSTTTEGNSVVFLSWSAVPGSNITYNVNRASAGGAPETVNEDPLSTTTCTDDNDGDGLGAGTYTYTIQALGGTGTTPIPLSNSVTVIVPTAP